MEHNNISNRQNEHTGLVAWRERLTIIGRGWATYRDLSVASRSLIRGGHSYVKWWVRGQWKGRQKCIEWCNTAIRKYLLYIIWKLIKSNTTGTYLGDEGYSPRGFEVLSKVYFFFFRWGARGASWGRTFSWFREGAFMIVSSFKSWPIDRNISM